MVFKAWEDLTIQDNYMFQRVMQDKSLCKQMLEEILNHPIREQGRTARCLYRG